MMQSFIKTLFAFLLCLQLPALAQQDPEIFEKFESKFYTIDGYKINVEMKGSGDPIFFLPGGPGNSHDYMQGNFGHYYKTNTVVFFDWIGRGKSDDAKDASEYAVEKDVLLIEKLRKLLNFDKISLVGHSYGTVPAQAYAIKYADNVDKMVLINGFHSGAMWQANCDSYNHYAKTHFPEKWKKVDSLRALGYLSSEEPLKSLYGSFPTKYIYYHNTKLKQNVPKEKFRGWANDVYTTIIGVDGDFHVAGSMINQDYRRKLKDVEAKTLIIAGRYDGVSTPEFAVQYKTFMPQAQFVMFEQSSHNPYLEEPEKFYTLFDEFMEIK
ncbi:proline iminopeptidase [Oceanihabitans sediminis]|uniref:alpha/beta fold hydrolase n=1 Tax=Oceanihabitans sediminis TaxID=1812012 RepID=UPI000B23A75D|nr:alpha/beta fold hydrolase [Oceanihabitans sediminis]MDX1364939.1 alpha/beta fold hydrolase [Arenibacter latericius]MDX1773130.1 alpha/beta fold hydrolase [Oceanihabitans sediminis]RBP34824.1 proline iminopeptidase [Oceanihabitans sediminis]